MLILRKEGQKYVKMMTIVTPTQTAARENQTFGKKTVNLNEREMTKKQYFIIKRLQPLHTKPQHQQN